MDRITFKDSDIIISHLEFTAEKIANFLYNHRSKLNDFISFMRISGTWTLQNYRRQLQIWSAGIRGKRKNAAPDTLQLISLAEEFFDVCRNENDRKKMRGLVPEKLFAKVFQDRHGEKQGNFGYGVMIVIDGEDVKYECLKPYENREDSDRNRQTVDAAYWDGKVGEFVEVKFNPEAFHTKDIKYLQILQSRLKEANLSHSILLVAFNSKDLIRRKLERLKLWSFAKEFYLVGSEELFNLGKSL